MEFLSENVKLLCPYHHLFWWHRNPIEAHEWLQTAIPVDRQKKLKLASQTYLGPFDTKLSILGLEHELASYESGDVALGARKQKVSPAHTVLSAHEQGYLRQAGRRNSKERRQEQTRTQVSDLPLSRV